MLLIINEESGSTGASHDSTIHIVVVQDLDAARGHLKSMGDDAGIAMAMVVDAASVKIPHGIDGIAWGEMEFGNLKGSVTFMDAEGATMTLSPPKKEA